MIESNISHDEFVSVNNMLKEYVKKTSRIAIIDKHVWYSKKDILFSEK